MGLTDYSSTGSTLGISHGRRASTPSASTAPLLPSHRFYSAAAIRASPFCSIPAHYLKRRGVLLLLICMAGIAYLHYEYMPSPGRVRFDVDGEDLDLDSLSDYQSIQQIREPPLAGPAPINGVDKDGFEIVKDPFGLESNNDNSNMDRSSHKNTVDVETENSDRLGAAAPFKIRRPIQFNFRNTLARTGAQADLNKQRMTVIKDMIQHAWTGYVKYAAPQDELRPVTATAKSSDKDVKEMEDGYEDWGATLVDSMDTLLLADMNDEFLASKKMFLDRVQQHHWNLRSQEEKDAKAEELNKQESIKDSQHNGDSGVDFLAGVVRYLGGLISIAELENEQDPNVLQAAVSLGDRLVQAFNTTNTALPGRKIFENGAIGKSEVFRGKVSLAEVGTFQLEFRKLSQLSGNNKYQSIVRAQRNFDYLASLKTHIPGLYPTFFDPDTGAPVAQQYVASFGSFSDSFYEYLLKSYLLTNDIKFKDLCMAYGTREQDNGHGNISTIEAMHARLISRPRKKSEPYLVLGVYDSATASLVPKMDHLSCFVPGLLALGARVLGRSKDMAAARGLMETCYLSYKNSATGLGADEIGFLVSPEYSKGYEYEMPPPAGFYVIEPEYALRPETVESLFILYRITGDAKYQDYAWEIAQAIEKNCRTKAGYSTIANVMDASEGMTDKMPSHFLGQTLKYLYLIFSPPDIASLDEFLFTTEGHLMKYPIV
ncbi:hypothetical protein EDD11_001922 [Mortierella claussenii]|nr:hypothetical protein EDD11_001922 [Mortierella claussenii]